MMMTFTEVKGHQRSNVVSYATFLNIVILYYLLMRRDVWFANHLVPKKVGIFIRLVLDREAKWKRKKTKFGLVCWHNTSKQAIEQSSSEKSKWSAIKKTVKTLITDNRCAFWRDYIKPLFSRVIFSKSLILSSVI